MAFTSFKNIAEVQKAYQIRYERKSDLIVPHPFQPSDRFTQTFEFLSNTIDIYSSEEMRKMAVIFPMLTDIYQHHDTAMVMWSEEYISVPDDDKLQGHPDFLISLRSQLGLTVLEKPFLIIAEAKEDNFTKGWGQCLAAMVAAQKLNRAIDVTAFGIVTNGQMWQFGHLKQDLFEQQESPISRPDAFGYLKAIFSATEDEIRGLGKQIN